MQAPHWLDDIFADPRNSVAALTSSNRFLAAIAAAQRAFFEQEDVQKKNPGLCGSSPAQSGRNAFLEAINRP
ncbi:MAG TPA: hypothetical protein VGM05_18565 [Planctomycetaceae bacterium]|jgi:hypothetical protein